MAEHSGQDYERIARDTDRDNFKDRNKQQRIWFSGPSINKTSLSFKIFIGVNMSGTSGQKHCSFCGKTQSEVGNRLQVRTHIFVMSVWMLFRFSANQSTS